MLEGDAKWGAFYSANFFALTSYQENFGISVVEALSCGCPVLISDQVNIWKSVNDTNAGFVTPLKISQISKRLIEIGKLSDTVLLDYKMRARNLFLTEFNWKTICIILQSFSLRM